MQLDQLVGKHRPILAAGCQRAARMQNRRMESWLAWGVLGLALIIAEVLSAGTFYLLMLGAAAFGAAAAAGLGLSFAVQSVVFSVVGAIGCYGVHAYRAKNKAQQMAPIDAGQPAKIQDLLRGLAAYQLLGPVWFDIGQHAGIYHQDWRIEDHQAAGQALRSGLRRYLRP